MKGLKLAFVRYTYYFPQSLFVAFFFHFVVSFVLYCVLFCFSSVSCLCCVCFFLLLCFCAFGVLVWIVSVSLFPFGYASISSLSLLLCVCTVLVRSLLHGRICPVFSACFTGLLCVSCVVVSLSTSIFCRLSSVCTSLRLSYLGFRASVRSMLHLLLFAPQSHHLHPELLQNLTSHVCIHFCMCLCCFLFVNVLCCSLCFCLCLIVKCIPRLLSCFMYICYHPSVFCVWLCLSMRPIWL